MKPDKKKDNLTDVVEQVSQPAEKPATVGDGQVVSGGEVVTLGIDAELQKDIDKTAKEIVGYLKKDKK